MRLNIKRRGFDGIYVDRHFETFLLEFAGTDAVEMFNDLRELQETLKRNGIDSCKTVDILRKTLEHAIMAQDDDEVRYYAKR